jgi:iron complex transport system ATP-binding protein
LASTVLLVDHDTVSAVGDRPAPTIELRSVTVTVDGRPILEGIEWTVEHGQQWVVIGPNGGGKSTLLRVAGLALHPSLGTIRVLGHLLGRVDIRPLRARIGTSSAALADQLRGSLPAIDIVRCGRFGALEPWWHRYDPADTERAERLLAQVGLKGYGPRTFTTLSSGERQRTLLARTLMPEPQLVLLDEPMAGLDFAGREELVAALEDLAGDRGAPPSVLVTHHVEDIPATATHLLALAGGRAVASGPIGTTLTAELMTGLFGLPVRLSRSHRRWSATRA